MYIALKINSLKSLKILLFCAFLAVNCQKGITQTWDFGILNRQTENTIWTAPFYKDSAVKRTYAEFNYCRSRMLVSYFADMNIYKVFSEKFFSLVYGVSGYAGGVYIVDWPNSNFYDAEGFAVSIQPSINLPLGKRLHCRLIGLKATYLYETGAFAVYRSDLASQGRIERTFPSNSLVNLCLTHSVIYNTNYYSAGYYFCGGVASDLNLTQDFSQYDFSFGAGIFANAEPTIMSYGFSLIEFDLYSHIGLAVNLNRVGFLKKL